VLLAFFILTELLDQEGSLVPLTVALGIVLANLSDLLLIKFVFVGVEGYEVRPVSSSSSG